jgi:hypothetical protein
MLLIEVLVEASIIDLTFERSGLHWRVRLPPGLHRGSSRFRVKRGGGKVHHTEEQLSVMRGGLTVEEWRRKVIRKFRP